MGIHLNSQQAAEELATLLTNADGAPTISGRKIRTLTRAHAFTDHGSGRSVAIDIDELRALAARTRYVADPTEIDDLVFRVSCIESRPDEVHDLVTGVLLRDEAGLDYRYPLARGGYEGVWQIGDYTLDRIIQGATLLATCKGYVHPAHVRQIVDYQNIVEGSRRYLNTTEPKASVTKAVGTGIWIDVPPGRESGILVG